MAVDRDDAEEYELQQHPSALAVEGDERESSLDEQERDKLLGKPGSITKGEDEESDVDDDTREIEGTEEPEFLGKGGKIEALIARVSRDSTPHGNH